MSLDGKCLLWIPPVLASELEYACRSVHTICTWRVCGRRGTDVRVDRVFSRPRGVASEFHRWYRREVKRAGRGDCIVRGELMDCPQMNARGVHYCL